MKNHNIGFTQNINGVFIDITGVPIEIINELILFVDHCVENQKMLKSARQHQFKTSLKPQTSPDTKNISNKTIHIELDDTSDTTPQDTEDDVLSSQNMQQLVTDPIKKSGSRFHNTRKKHSRLVATKVVYVNDLRKE